MQANNAYLSVSFGQKELNSSIKQVRRIIKIIIWGVSFPCREMKFRVYQLDSN